MSERILIVGAGVVGLSTACYGARRGFTVTVIERGAADEEGCSFGNAGLITPSHIVPLASPGMIKLGIKYLFDPEGPFHIRPRPSGELWFWAWRFWRSATTEHVLRAAPLIRDLNLASRDCYEELLAEIGDDCALKRDGVINLCRTERGLAQEAQTAELARRVGLTADVVDARRARELYGDLNLNVVGGVHYPQDYFLSPNRFMAGLRRLAERWGVRIEWGTELTGWRTDGRRVSAALTARGEREADQFVICAGSWSPRVARGLDLDIPIQAGKGYSVTLTHPPRRPKIAAILSEARVAITPMGAALRFGGTMEIAGLDESITTRRVNRIIRAACQHLTDFSPADFAGVAPWRGLRPVTPDGLPYIGRTRQFDNLAVAAGHAMMGFSLGPITGRLIAAILAGETPPLASPLLSPDRFARRRQR
ncbi:MAG TPA: FAD-dependent oxidoreductase [bacterium]|nr:FAD-dependent oxidoreductase [bacterium]